nr:unnamed protein product [Callosobruchus chinensis]
MQLLGKYTPPKNCPLIKGPHLNPEVKTAISEAVYKRDQRLRTLQHQIGAGLTCIGTVLSLVLQEEGGGNRRYIELLSDAGKLLADIHRRHSSF